MRAIVCLLIVGLSLAQLVQFDGSFFKESREIDKIPDSDEEKISIKAGLYVLLSLPANPKPAQIDLPNWFLMNKDQLKLLEFKDSSTKGAFQFPEFPAYDKGMQAFTFLAKTAGLETLVLNYMVDKGAAPKVYKVNVTIT